MSMNCTKCGRSIEPKEASNPCSECGSMDRNIMVEDTIHVFEMLGLKAKQDGFTLFQRKQGEKLSRHERKAREFLEIDRRDPEKTTKIHIVEEQMDDGTWELKHDESKVSPAKHRPKQSE